MIIPIENQVCTLESARRLKDLGCRQDTEFFWSVLHYRRPDEIKASVIRKGQAGSSYRNKTRDLFSAYSVAELSMLLPNYFGAYCYYGEWTCREFCRDNVASVPENPRVYGVFGDSEANVKAKMLIHLISSGLVGKE